MGFSPAFLDGLRRQIPLSEVIGRRGVKLVRRGHEFVGHCPFHGERTPSFYVVETKRFFHCFGCGMHGDAIDFVMRVDHLDFLSAVAKLAGEPIIAGASQANFAAPINEPAIGEEDERSRRIAWWLWAGSCDARGTLAETYLRGRFVGLPPTPVLRFAPRCWNREIGRELPAMLARVEAPNGEFVAVHRTWLSPDGGKAALRNPKMSLGPIRGAAVRLAPAGPELVIAEGIENALSAIAAGYAAWSAVSAGGLQHVVLPDTVQSVLIVADHDRSGVGERSGRSAGQRFIREGRRVRLWVPREPGTDANDVLMGC
ncbi:MAG: CHC2 zinc finger domain-containing protein [Stellaceae bacterium]